MENMRYYLASMNSSLPLFLGRRFRDSSRNVNFLAGGPGSYEKNLVAFPLISR